MDLSIIIVNYNVRYFLEQCLKSALKACEPISAEIIVVDNASSDGSQQMIRDKFGNCESITLIENKDNPGFSKANNQGIAIAKGRYVLLLNPDTVVAEDTFLICRDFMDAHPKAGGLGVQMIDGNGQFLPESKRALPTPWVSFCKIFGLSSLFPKSRFFGRYHLSFLDQHQNHEIEILSGAFMWMRKSLLDEIGYLDEDFFMYGEDIDLSYRINLAGSKNYYLADTRIIHYKGESTKKGSLNYVRVFYQAMIIFARKHFGGSRKKLFILAIRLAVYFRALIAILHRLVNRLGFPLLEAGMIYAVIYGIKAYWEHYVKYIEGGTYPAEFVHYYMPAYTLVFVAFLGLAGAYKKPYRLRPLILAPFWAFLAIASGSFLFQVIRNFSRAILGLSAIFTMILAIANRGLIHWRKNGSFFFTETSQNRVLLVGYQSEIQRVKKLILEQLHGPMEIVGAVWMETQKPASATLPMLGPLSQLKALVRSFDIQEVIFCNDGNQTRIFLDQLARLKTSDLHCKLAPPASDFIIGPKQIYTSRNQLFHHFRLQQASVLREKRLFDMVVSGLLLLSFPLLFWAYGKKLSAFQALFSVLFGKKHLVAYINSNNPNLPVIKKGLLSMLDRSRKPNDQLSSEFLDQYYAESFRWELDLEIIIKAWRRIH